MLTEPKVTHESPRSRSVSADSRRYTREVMPRKEISSDNPNTTGEADVPVHKSIVPKKARGANHRSFYTLSVEIGFILALLILIGLVRAPMYPRVQEVEIVMSEQQVIQMEEIQQTRQELPPPPPPRPSVPIEVADDVVLEDEILDLDVTLDMDEPVATIPPPPPAPPAAKKEEVVEEPEIFVVVEDMPELIGGTEALMKEVQYPPMARQAGVEGLVIIQFVVDEKGNPINPFVAKGIGAGCDEEALRAVMKMKFKPGMQRGKPVKVQYAVPVRFMLKEEKK